MVILHFHEKPGRSANRPIDEDIKAHARDGTSELTIFVATTFLRWVGSSGGSRIIPRPEPQVDTICARCMSHAIRTTRNVSGVLFAPYKRRAAMEQAPRGISAGDWIVVRAESSPWLNAWVVYPVRKSSIWPVGNFTVEIRQVRTIDQPGSSRISRGRTHASFERVPWTGGLASPARDLVSRCGEGSGRRSAISGNIRVPLHAIYCEIRHRVRNILAGAARSPPVRRLFKRWRRG